MIQAMEDKRMRLEIYQYPSIYPMADVPETKSQHAAVDRSVDRF